MLPSISSEGSDDAPEEFEGIDLVEEGLSTRSHNPKYLGVDGLDNQHANRQRRLSRAPLEIVGRTGVWGMNEVSGELRTLAGDALWELAARGEEHKLAEVALHSCRPAIDTALLLAAWHGLTDLTQRLLKCGASPNMCDPKGRTPLHLASCAGADDCVNLLLKAGAAVNTWDGARRATPLHCAAAAPSPACVRLLLKAGALVDAGRCTAGTKSPLHLAVQAGNAKVVEILLIKGASPNTPQLYTETPLHVAAALGSAECMRLLLNGGADVRVQAGASRATPLHLAAEDGNAACARMLLDANADPSVRNTRQQTPLHLAALAQSAETLELLLQRGGDPNSIDAGGRTPLHSAIVKGSRSCECVRLLVEHGADVNRADAYGYTPLHIAALSEFSSCVELLIRNGGHVTARTKGGVSALSFMVRRTPDALRKFLECIDSGISLHEHELGDVDCTLKLDFKVLVPRTTNGESELLLSFIEVGQRHLLQHPLCQTFLFLKWKQIRKFFLISLLFHALFVALHTGFVVTVFLDPGTDDHQIRTLRLHSCILGYALLVMNIVLVAKELFQIAHSKVKYTQHWENWLQWLIVISVFACVEVLWISEWRPLASWQHHVAAFGVFFTWIEMMMLVGRFPMFGLYVQMFTTVAANFARFLLAYSCLLVAFGLSFAILFPHYPAFKTVPRSLLKTVVMMVGELEFEDMFFGNQPVLYKGTAPILFLAFILLASVVLMNLMVGLAVSDIQGLQRSAGLDRLVRQAELISHIESILFSKICANLVPRWLTRFCTTNALLVTSNYRRAIYIRPNDPRECRIPKDLVEGAYRLVATRTPARRRKEHLNALTDIRHVSQYSTRSVSDHQIDTSVLDHIRGQLSLLVSQTEQNAAAGAAVSHRITNLGTQVEALRRELCGLNSRINLLDKNYSKGFTSEPNISITESASINNLNKM